MDENEYPSYWIDNGYAAQEGAKYGISPINAAQQLALIAGDYANMTDEDVLETFQYDVDVADNNVLDS